MRLRIYLIFILGLSLIMAACSQSKSGAENIVNIVQINPPVMLEQLRSGEIDGFVAWEPFTAEAVQEGSGKYLLFSRDIWADHPCCVLAVAPSIEKNEELIKALIWAHVKATRFINNPANKNAVFQYALEFTGKSEAVIKEALTNVVFVEYPRKEELASYYQELAEEGLIVKELPDLGFADAQVFFDNFLWDQLYQEVIAELSKNSAWQPAKLPNLDQVRLGYINQDLHELAVYIAAQEGYYLDVGLIDGENLELKQFNNGVAIMEAFKAKELDASYLGGAPATLKRLNDDIPIRVVAGGNDEGSALVVAAASDIASVQELQNKTIAVPQIGTVQYFLLQKAVTEAGLQIRIK